MPIIIKCPYCGTQYDLTDHIDEYIKSRIDKGVIPQSIVPCVKCRSKFYIGASLILSTKLDCELNNKQHIFEETLHRYHLCMECGKISEE